MPNQKASGITARISVDTVDARSSVNSLKRSIRQLNTRFRDTYRSQLMAGHAEDALRTKNEGAKEQYEALSDAIKKVRAALDRAKEAQETGTHNYHQTELDLQNLVEWRKRENYTIEHTNHLLIFHNRDLQKAIETEKHDLEVGRQRVEQYKAEGNELKAQQQVRENRIQRIRDLDNVTKQYISTERRAKEANVANSGNKNYDRIIEGERQARAERAKTRREIEMDTTDLKSLDREAENSRENSQSRIREYNAENRTMKANAERINDLKNKLRQLRSISMETSKDLNQQRNSGHGDSDEVDRLVKKTYQLRAATASAKSELDDLQNGIPTLNRYNNLYNQSTRSVVNSLKKLRGSAEAGREEYILLGQNIRTESTAVTKQAERTRAAARANSNAKDSTGKLSYAYQRENAKLQALNATFKSHQKRIRDLRSTYGAMTQTTATRVDKLTSHMNRLDKAAHRDLRAAHALTNGSIALGAAFIYGVKQSAGLENEFNKIKNLLNTSGESFKEAGNDINAMGKETTNLSLRYGQSQKTIANGFEALVRRGYTGKQALASQKYYLQGTIASGDKYNDVMHTAASTLEAFNMRSNNTNLMVGNTKKVVNQLAYAADLTATDFKGIAYGMQYVGDTAHNTNQSVSMTSSALGELSNRGENATVAATGLRKILLSLSTIKSGKNNKLSQLGLKPSDLKDSSGNLKSLTDIFTILRSRMQGMSETKQTSIFKSLFGTTAVNSAAALMNSTKQLGDLNKQVAKSQDQEKGRGYAARIANKNMNTTEMQFKRLQAAGQELAKDYSQGLNPVFKRFSDIALSAADVLNDMPKSVKNIVTMGTLAIPTLAAFGYTLATVKKSISILNYVQREGLMGYMKSDEALKANTSSHKSYVDVIADTTDAQRQLNEAKEQGINIDKQNATSTDADTAAQYNNAKSDKIGMAANRGENTTSGGLILPNGVSSNTESESTSGSRISREVNRTKNGLSRIPWKSALGAGALTGGSEILAGDSAGGAQDAVGTTGGMLTGGALGAIGGPLGSKIGSMAGMVAGPMITRGIVHAVNHPYQVGKNLSSQSGEDRSNDRSLTNNLKHINTTTQAFVRNEANENAKAATQFAANGGKVSKSLRQTAMSMYWTAKNYGERQLKGEDDTLNKAAKNHQISNQQRLEGEQNLQSSESSLVSKISNYDSQAVNNTHLTASQREKLLSKADRAEMQLTSTSGSKQERLLSNLNHRASRLNTESYAAVLSQANSNYKATSKSASSHYKYEVSSAKNTYGLLEKAGVLHHKSASKSVSNLESLYGSQRNDTVGKARDTSKSVSTAASEMADNTTKKHYKASLSVSAANSSMASDDARIAADNAKAWHKFTTGLETFFQTALYDIRHPTHPHENKKVFNDNLKENPLVKDANGTPDTQHVIVDNPLVRGMSSYANGSYDTTGLHFATGVLPGIQRTENAVINDGDGRELVKLPNGQLVLPRGRNVHTVLPKGTSVFNAMQTRRLLGPAVSHADGTVNDKGVHNSVRVKMPRGSLAKTEKNTRKSMKNIHDVLDKGYKKTGKDVKSHLDDLHDNSSDSWDDNRDITKKHVKDIHDDTISRYGDLKNSLNKTQDRSNQLTNAHLNTTVSYFRHHFAMIPPITRTSMQSGISNINSGINSIDRVLAQFGGNSHVLSAAHYAAGTSGPSANRQMAILNDATGGPSQEAIVSDQGRVRMPRGRNVPAMLDPGDKVLNGSDTLRALRTGLIPHYAGGLKSNDALRKLASHYAKTPTSFTNDTFNKFANVIGSLFSKDMTVDSKNGAQHPANNWSSAMWHYIDSLINGGSSSKLLNKAEQLGRAAKGYSENLGKRMGPSYYDCASLVWTALKDLGVHVNGTTVGPIMSAFSGNRVSRNDAKPGDLVGSHDHIGLVADKGAHHYYSAQDPSDGIGMEPLEESAFPDGWFHIERVPQLADHTDHYRSSLNGLVKRQLGDKSSKWIQSTLGDALDGGGTLGNPAGNTISRWIPTLKRALRANHFEASNFQVNDWLRTISRESTGNPHAYNGYDSNAQAGHPTKGLAQDRQDTFDNNAFPGHHNIYNGYDNLLASIHYAASAYGRSPYMFNRVAAAGYANGGLSQSDQMAHISEGNRPEMVLPLTNKSRAVELMLKSLRYMFGDQQKANHNNNQGQESGSDREFERELIQSNKQKDFEINKLVKTTNNILSKMSLLIKTVQEKPVISNADIYRGNRKVAMNKMRLRNFNRGTF